MSSSVLPWKWVIEYLADVPYVGTSILSALVERFPEVLADSSGDERERLSLRYLEEGSGMASGETPPAVATNAPSTSASATKIDAALTCEEVLLSRVATTNVDVRGKAGLDGGDLHKFILLKRATLPKSSIELLKEKVLRSYHPDFSYSKECNGLPKVSRSVRVDHLTFNNHSDHDSIKKILRTKHASPWMKKLTIIRKYRKLKKLANNTALSTVGGASPKISSTLQHLLKQQVPDDEKKNQQTNADGTWNVQFFATEKATTNTCEEFHNVGMQSRKENLSGYVPTPNGDSHDLEGSLRSRQQSQKQNILHDDRADFEEVAGSDCDDLQFFEQSSMHHSSSTQSLCIKCGRSGQLLNCRGDGCSRFIHKSCLVLLASVEKNGLFYCPLCTYRNAHMMYKKSRRTAEEARRNLFLFYDIGPTVHDLKRKNSSAKIMTGSDQISANHNSSEHPDLPSNQQLQNSSGVQKYDDAQNAETSNSKFVRDNNQGITQNQQNQLNGEVDMVCKIILPCRETIERHAHNDVQDTPTKLKSDPAREHESTRVTEDQQHLDDHRINDNVSVPCDMNASHYRNGDICVTNSRTKVCRDHLQVDETKNLHTGDADQEPIFLQASKRSPLNIKGERDHDVKRKVPASQISDRFAKRNRRDKAVKFGNYQGVVKNQQTDISSSRDLRKNKYCWQNQGFTPKRSPSRRMILIWKPEEEKILEEAMQKIPKNEDGGIPWTKILEYGRFFLHESRTTIDLKDKWRNMQKKKAKRRV
ncbi:hypothetical protein M5K25_012936 [Dendrobium thyrsiflorum]|uniref:Myb-like domain-containing protein n=1 Tax=Dendrobium thyrsiflorum TaxID=117978 RepID=A0ABD0UY49_DENTH